MQLVYTSTTGSGPICPGNEDPQIPGQDHKTGTQECPGGGPAVVWRSGHAARTPPKLTFLVHRYPRQQRVVVRYWSTPDIQLIPGERVL